MATENRTYSKHRNINPEQSYSKTMYKEGQGTLAAESTSNQYCSFSGLTYGYFLVKNIYPKKPVLDFSCLKYLPAQKNT